METPSSVNGNNIFDMNNYRMDRLPIREKLKFEKYLESAGFPQLLYAQTSTASQTLLNSVLPC